MALLLTARAAADEPSALRIALRVEGTCPEEGAVRAALLEALPELRFVDERAPGAPQPAELHGAAGDAAVRVARVADLGSRLAVEVGSTTRLLERPARDCAGRAREAALALALLLEPPLLVDVAPAPAAVPSAAAAAQVGTAEVGTAGVDPAAPAVEAGLGPPRWTLDLSLSALGAGTVHEGVAGSVGGVARIEAARGVFGGALAAGALAPVVVSYGAASVRLLRVPIDLSATATRRRPRYELGAQAGLALIPFVASGEAVALPRTGTGLDLGLRLGVSATWRAADRVGLRGGIELVLVPVPALLTDDRGQAFGPTPWLFAGATLGPGWRIR